ncbi:alpha/beta hydrolase [Acidithiobacillus montserratensis]|uniref:Alpha/beta hydrolase n=1 Tax=Acidithiobacillus montserratensis TaxID=2729135 RepID=A0ACD5HFN9_9PROT|nr:alpha/beta hydrolase [Acidithiobacillus montserratensis]MBU2748444.1 alpha/beta hydrolase [Acidithiobacillus montserratensis]
MTTSAERSFTLVHASGERLSGLIHENHQDPVGIFLPGFASNMQGSKSRMLAAYARQQDWSWVRFDPRGVGRSDGVFEKLTLSRYLEDLHLVLQMLENRPVILVGSSMGGWLATIAATRWPERVRALLLIAPAFNFIQTLFQTLSPEDQQHWQDNNLRCWQDHYGLGELRMHFDLVADSWQYDLLRFPAYLHCPVEILHGTEDEAVPLSLSYQFAACTRCEQLVLRPLPGIHHRLQGADRVLLHSLQRLWPAE